MKAEGTGFARGGGYGGDANVPKKARKIPQGKPWDPTTSPTAMRTLSPAEQAAKDARDAQLAEARKKRQARPRTGRTAAHGMTHEQVAQIVELYKGGMSAKKVAETVGCSRTTVLKYLELNEVPIRGGRQPRTDVVEEATRLYARGLSLREVGKELGVSNTTVRTHLMNAGVEIRSQGQWRSERGAA